MASTLKLTYNTIAITFGLPGLTPFADGNFPRERPETPTFGRTANGAVTKEGIAYDLPHLWNVSVILLPADSATLLRIFDLWLEDGANQYLRLHDLVRPVTERGDRTRALAEGAPAQEISGSGSTAIRTYFAQFNALFQSEPKCSKDGSRQRVTFTLIEGAKVAP